MVKLAEAGERVDVVLMDPPRSGSDEKFLASVVKLKPERVVYISCNPETLARDLKYLCGKGYRMVKGKAYDMFPFTSHVESTVLLQRRWLPVEALCISWTQLVTDNVRLITVKNALLYSRCEISSDRDDPLSIKIGQRSDFFCLLPT